MGTIAYASPPHRAGAIGAAPSPYFLDGVRWHGEDTATRRGEIATGYVEWSCRVLTHPLSEGLTGLWLRLLWFLLIIFVKEEIFSSTKNDFIYDH
jgi:hypothetical protein